MLVKMRDYLDTFSRFKNKQIVQETEAWLETEFKELESFERSQLGRYTYNPKPATRTLQQNFVLRSTHAC